MLLENRLRNGVVRLASVDNFLTIFLRNKQRLFSLRESRQEVLCRGSDEESHLDNSEESWLFAEREGSPRDVDGDARNAPTPVPDDLHLVRVTRLPSGNFFESEE